MKHLFSYLFLVMLLSTCQASTDEYRNYKKALPELLQKMQIESDEIIVFIDKSEYKLIVMKDSVIIKEYPVVFGDDGNSDSEIVCFTQIFADIVINA
ncbi:MAG: L,D-transpeptidase [Marinilabiliaceae bacterium]|nr:L,D-transpeptidase [Marinilabiliaceae bacterium]